MTLSTKLREQIQAEVSLIEQVLYTLRKEHALLLENNVNDELFDLTDLKQYYVAELEQAGVKRDHALIEMGLPAGRDGFIAAQGMGDEWRDLVSLLFSLSSQANDLNQENGLLVAAYMEYNEKALAALNAANPSRSVAQVYDAKGAAHKAKSQRSGIASV